MPREKNVRPHLRKLRREEYRALHLFAASQGLELESITHNPMALELGDARYHDIFDVPVHVARKLGQVGSLYSAGFYLGFIDKSGFSPSLPLAHRLARLCNSLIKCITVSPEGEKFFLYGKPVLEDNLVEWAPGLRIVVNTRGEALGWGLGAKRGGSRMIEPIKDLGWYLRRGG